MATVSVTPAQAKAALLKINGNMGSTWWLRPTMVAANIKEVDAKNAWARLVEVDGRGQTTDLTGTDGDVYNLL